MVQVDITVPARTWLDGMGGEFETPTATCGVPHLYSHGRLRITLSVKDGTAAQEMRFTGYVSVIWGAPLLNATFSHSDNHIIFSCVVIASILKY